MRPADYSAASAPSGRVRWRHAWAVCAVVGAVVGVRLWISYRAFGHPISFGDAIATGMLEWGLWGLLFPLIAYLARRFPLDRGRLFRHFAVHLAGSVAVALLHLGSFLAATATIRSLRFGAPWRIESFGIDILGQFPADVAIYGLAVAVLCFLDSRERAAHLRAELAAARLRALQLHLQPHFLFNTLNAIAAAIHMDPVAAERMLTRLGALLARVLATADMLEVELEKEAELLRAYLDIEELRFGDRVAFELAFEPETSRACVPPFLLQPLVENAIHHGVARRIEGGTIAVRAARKGERLCLEIEDDGPGLAEPAPGGRVGLANTRARLRELYAAEHDFELSSGARGGLLVHIELPWRVRVTTAAGESK